MRFKLDENMPSTAAAALGAAGHDAITVPEQQLSGQPDGVIAVACRTESRALITLDLDFADIRAYAPSDYAGIIVLRAPVNSVTQVLSLLGEVLRLLTTEVLTGRLWIVTADRIRVHE